MPQQQPQTTAPAQTTQGLAGEPGGAVLTPQLVEAEITDLLNQMLVAWASCAFDPDACEPSTQLGSVYGGNLLEVASNEITERAATGRRTFPPESPEQSRVDLLEVRMESIASSTASITYCHIDGSTLVEPNAERTDVVIIDDSIASITREAELERNANGEWRMVSRRSTKLFENGGGCDQ